MVRFFQPRAADAQLLVEGHADPLAARKLRDEGLFEAALPNISETAPRLPATAFVTEQNMARLLSTTTLTRSPICSPNLICI